MMKVFVLCTVLVYSLAQNSKDNTNTNTGANTDPNYNTNTGSNTNTGANTDPNTDPNTNTNTNTGSTSNDNTNSNTNTGANTDPTYSTSTGSISNDNTNTDPTSNTNTGTNTDPNTEPNTNTDTNTNTNDHNNINTKADDIISSCGQVFCPNNVDLICGTDGVTYGTPCDMFALTCGTVMVAYKGQCGNTNTNSNPNQTNSYINTNNDGTISSCGQVICPNRGDILCGTDGVTYMTPCDMFVLTCGTVMIDHRGECANDPLVG